MSAGMWTLPGGGMQFGEHPEETVLRELHEETGLEGRVTRLLDVRSEIFPAWRHHSELQVIGFIYEVAALGTPRVVEEQGSTVEAAWVSLDQAAALPHVGLVDHAMGLLP